MFVVRADFDNQPYNIPNLDKVQNSFAAFVEREEEEQLTSIIGYTLYKQFTTGLAVTPTPDQKWLDLRDGKEYINSNGKIYKYKGMKKIFIPYIYAMWLRANFDNDSAVGIALALTENAEIISPSTRICNAYNDHSKLVGDSCINNSLYGFLKTNEEVYPDFEFTCPGEMNIFNL